MRDQERTRGGRLRVRRPGQAPAVARDGNWRTRLWRVPAAWAAAEDDARARAPLESSGSDDDECAGGLGGLFGEGSESEPPDAMTPT